MNEQLKVEGATESSTWTGELSPCPFCDSVAVVWYNQRRHDFSEAVECGNRLCRVFLVSDTGGRAAEKWNRRAAA